MKKIIIFLLINSILILTPIQAQEISLKCYLLPGCALFKKDRTIIASFWMSVIYPTAYMAISSVAAIPGNREKYKDEVKARNMTYFLTKDTYKSPLNFYGAPTDLYSILYAFPGDARVQYERTVIDANSYITSFAILYLIQLISASSAMDESKYSSSIDEKNPMMGSLRVNVFPSIVQGQKSQNIELKYSFSF